MTSYKPHKMYQPVCLLLLGLCTASLASRMGPKTPRPGDFAQCRLSEDLREQFVDIHNEVRGQVQPTAADMEYLEWSDDLGNLAQMWSDKCEWMHGFTAFGAWHPNKEYRSTSVGQNLAREWGKWLEQEKGPEDAVRRWFNERNNYTFAKFAYPMPRWMCRRKPCGHYTQVVWAKSMKVGCALKWCNKEFGQPHPWIPGETVVTCDYYPSGNVVGQLPYTTGPPCSKCASGEGWCYKNLCRECKDFSPKCGTSGFTKDKCLTETDLMEKYCPRTCNLCRCPLQCKNGGQVVRKTCTCRCYGKWKGSDCSEKICDQGWYGDNCEKPCVDKVGTSTCKWRVQNGHPCAVAYMKIDCVKTCICDLMPKPAPNPQPPATVNPKPTVHPTTKQQPPPTTSKLPSGQDCNDTCESHCKFWAGLGECKKQPNWMRKNCMKTCQVCTCQDAFNSATCQKWAARGECEKNSQWMEVNCPRSCLVCDCHDKHTSCGQWTKAGECGKNAVWMDINCKKSCKKC